MNNRLVEILVYTDGGIGASHSCVRLAIDGIAMSLASISTRCSKTVEVSTTTSEDICKGRLSNGRTKLLVMPGGRDLPFCQKLNGLGNRYIRDFVETGGSYLGLCAGGYYACAAIQFSKGDRELEICDERELKLYPGTAIGPLYPGFCYSSNKGARSVSINISKTIKNLIDTSIELDSMNLNVYYNGGPYFTHPDPCFTLLDPTSEPSSPNMAEVLASYSTGEAAVVQCVVGDGAGRVVLCGPHVEALPSGLQAAYEDDNYIAHLVSSIEATDDSRHTLFTSIIQYLIG